MSRQVKAFSGYFMNSIILIVLIIAVFAMWSLDSSQNKDIESNRIHCQQLPSSCLLITICV